MVPLIDAAALPESVGSLAILLTFAKAKCKHGRHAE
jgi:hypothetical protein